MFSSLAQSWLTLWDPMDSQESSPTPQFKIINSLVLGFQIKERKLRSILRNDLLLVKNMIVPPYLEKDKVLLYITHSL